MVKVVVMSLGIATWVLWRSLEVMLDDRFCLATTKNVQDN